MLNPEYKLGCNIGLTLPNHLLSNTSVTSELELHNEVPLNLYLT